MDGELEELRRVAAKLERLRREADRLRDRRDDLILAVWERPDAPAMARVAALAGLRRESAYGSLLRAQARRGLVAQATDSR